MTTANLAEKVVVQATRQSAIGRDDDVAHALHVLALDHERMLVIAVGLGQVADLMATGPHSVLRCVVPAAEGQDAVERLIPFVSAYIDSVSLADKRIVADWGLDY